MRLLCTRERMPRQLPTARPICINSSSRRVRAATNSTRPSKCSVESGRDTLNRRAMWTVIWCAPSLEEAIGQTTVQPAASVSPSLKTISLFSVQRARVPLPRRNRRTSSMVLSASLRISRPTSWRRCCSSSPTREIRASTLNRIDRSQDHSTVKACPTNRRMFSNSIMWHRNSTSQQTKRRRRSC